MTSPACSDSPVDPCASAVAARAGAPLSSRCCASRCSAHGRVAFEPVRGQGHPGRGRRSAPRRERCSRYLPVKVGDRLDDEKASQAVKALFATGFFRDVRLEVQDGVLIVVVQERPTISRDRVLRQQGVRHRHAQEGAEGHRPRRGAHLRPLGARARRAGDQAPVHLPRPLRREGHDHGDAAGAQPRRDQLHDRGRRGGQDRPHQHRRHAGVQREGAARRDAADDAGLD